MEPADRHAVEHLIFEYARRMDDGDFDGIGALFAHGSVCDENGVVLARGADAVAAFYAATARRHADGTPGTHHVTTNLDIQAVGDDVTVASYFTVLQAVDDLPLQPVIAGRYGDRFSRVDDVWHFAERRMSARLVGNLDHHLLFDLP